MSSLKRRRYPMPEFIRQAWKEKKLMAAYLKRPPYQQNDYIGWISRAKQESTKMKRLDQMLDELAAGDKHMKMSYRG